MKLGIFSPQKGTLFILFGRNTFGDSAAGEICWLETDRLPNNIFSLQSSDGRYPEFSDRTRFDLSSDLARPVAPSDANFPGGRVDPPQPCSKANCATADKVTTEFARWATWLQEKTLHLHSFSVHKNIFKTSRSAYKTFVSDQGRASFLCEAKQKIDKKTWRYPVTPQCATRRFLLATAFC